MGVMIGYIYSFTFGVFLKDVMNMSVTIRSKNEMFSIQTSEKKNTTTSEFSKSLVLLEI